MRIETAGMDMRVALVTGGGGGLGGAATLRLAALGYLVAACDLDLDRLERVASAQSSSSRAVVMDVTDEASVAQGFDRVEAELGPVAVLVCCAGGTAATRSHQPRLAQTSVDEWIATEALNGRGTFLCVREMLRRRAVVPVAQSRIILTSSTAAQRPAIAAGVAYSAAKAGVVALARTAAVEAAPLGITVNVIAPGGFDTDAYHAATTEDQMALQSRAVPLGRLGRPDEFAGLVAFLASDQASYLTGATVDLNGGSRMA
jgi:3-oxoacyl-[acyl-carrier protein] reductase